MNPAAALFGFWLALGLVDCASTTATFQSVVDACKKAENMGTSDCAKGPFCIGYTEGQKTEVENKCTDADSFGSPECKAFYSVTKVKDDQFKMILVAQSGPNGWVSMVFHSLAGSIFAIVCRSGSKKIIASKGTLEPPYTEDPASTKLISEDSVTLDGDRVICLFKLTTEAPFDLTTNQYAVDLYVSDKGENENPTFRSSSGDPQDFWTILEIRTAADGDDGSGSTTDGSGPTLQPRMMLVMLLVATGLYAVTRQ